MCGVFAEYLESIVRVLSEYCQSIVRDYYSTVRRTVDVQTCNDAGLNTAGGSGHNHRPLIGSLGGGVSRCDGSSSCKMQWVFFGFDRILD